MLTPRGPIALEARYVAGVVDCEIAGITEMPAALDAQAIAARTYLARYLERQGRGAVVPVTARFQCWRPPKRPRAVEAAARTADQLLHRAGELITANYVAGAHKLSADCQPAPPKAHGYPYASWAAMRRAWLAARARGDRRPFDGVAWTEVVVTDNEGLTGDAVKGTPMASAHPTNRGALSQRRAVCLAEQGLDAPTILRHFYGEDVEVFEPLHEPLDPLEIPATPDS